MKAQRLREVIRLRIRSLFRRRRVETEMEKELRFHLDQQMEEGLASGLSPEDARVAALRTLGGIAQIQEECRDMRGISFFENLKQDLRYALRTLARSRGFTFVMILTLALSIGATSAIVSVVNGVLLRSLPYRDPAKLVNIFTSSKEFPKFPLNPNDFRDFRARLHSFECFAAYTRGDLQLSATGEAIRLSGFFVTAGFFHVLGISPAMGREFDQRDELPEKGHVAIVSDRIWRTRLAGSRNAIGQKIFLDAVPYVVVGVMPPGVQHPGNMYHAVAYGDTVDIWTPFNGYGDPAQRGSHFLDGIARLRPGVTVGQAKGEINAAMQQLAREHPGDQGWSVLVIPLATEIVGSSERLLFVLLGAVALVMLLACVNAANLLLARASARKRELALRAAVGAGRARLIQQMLTESALLAFMGAAAGSALAVGGIKVLVALLPADFPRIGDIHVDAPVFLFTLFVAVGSGLFFGLVPALHGSRADLRDSLHEGGRSTTNGSATLRLRNLLVVCEVTLACVLLIGAGLMLRSFVNLLEASPGFRPEQTVTASIALPDATYKNDKARSLFYERLLDQLRDSPGVMAAAVSSDLPWTGWDENSGGWTIQGETPPPNQFFHARYHEASEDYFRAVGIPLRRGRPFDHRDTADSPKVFVINEAMARYWKHGDALGGRVTFEDHPKEKDWMTVVGIVGDVKDNPKDVSATPAFWWPMEQAAFSNSSVAIRSTLAPALVADRLRTVVGELDRNLAVSDVRTLKEVAAGVYSTSRFALLLVGLFAVLALSLAAIGTYGVIAYAVNQRIHEFGVRMALGAQPADVARSVLAAGMRLAVIGTVVGIVLGLALSRLLGNLLYGVSPTDPVAVLATCVVTMMTAGLACWVPAMRATRADPMQALRAD